MLITVAAPVGQRTFDPTRCSVSVNEFFFPPVRAAASPRRDTVSRPFVR
jgi:hypothetical protein